MPPQHLVILSALLAAQSARVGPRWFGVTGFLVIGLYLAHLMWCALLARETGQRRTG
ncbi:MAG: hypothetical protein ABJA74_10880 [Lapillicoccus sp.]